LVRLGRAASKSGTGPFGSNGFPYTSVFADTTAFDAFIF
jgi:hypothetical protein